MTEFWNKKVVLLTGASSGIGAEIAVQIARKGPVLGLLARREESLREVSEAVEKAGGRARVFPYDVTDAEAVRAAASELREEFGQIDILIANAGIGGNDRETRMVKPEAVAKVIDINLLGAVNSVGAVLPEMLSRRAGHLVAISSLAGFRGLPRSAAYCASKAGVNAFFESLRVDFAGKGLDVTVITPGFIKTPLTSGRENKMPFLLELEDGAGRIIKAIEKKKAFHAFPFPLASLVRFGSYLPPALYDLIAGGAKYRE